MSNYKSELRRSPQRTRAPQVKSERSKEVTHHKREMTDSRTGLKKNNSVELMLYQKARKWSKKDEDMSKGLRSQLERQQNNFEHQNE